MEPIEYVPTTAVAIAAMSDAHFAAFERESIQAESDLCLDCPDPALCMAEADCCAGGVAR